MKKVLSSKIKISIPELILSIIIAFTISMGNRISFSRNVSDSLKNNYIRQFRLWDITLFIVSACLIYLVCCVIIDKQKKIVDILTVKKIGISNGKNFVLIVSVILLIAWSPYILSLAPGSVLDDSINSINQIMYGRYNNHHPFVYTLFIGAIFKLTAFFSNDINVGIFAYTIIQTLIMALTISKIVKIIADRFSVFLAILFTVYYAVIPFFPTYAIIMWKDPLYSCALAWVTICIYEIFDNNLAISDRIWIAKMSVSLLATALMRNNGIYIVIAVVILISIIFRKKAETIQLSGIIIIVAYAFFIMLISSKYHIKSEFAESVGIPLQQEAYVISNNGNLSENDKEYLFQLMTEEDWKSAYTPCLADSIKWSGNFNSAMLEKNHAEFIRVYFSVLVKNPRLMFEGWCLETFGFWKPCVQNDYGYIDTYITSNQYNIHYWDLFKKITGFSIQDKIKSFRIYIGSGTYFCIVLFAFVLTIRTNTKSYWLIYVPALVNLMTILIATPVAFSLRYVYIFPLCFPLFLLLPALAWINENTYRKESKIVNHKVNHAKKRGRR